jgi:hypothetical protein
MILDADGTVVRIGQGSVAQGLRGHRGSLAMLMLKDTRAMWAEVPRDT